ncbi:MAG: enolase, partial [Caldilineae bacterium]
MTRIEHIETIPFRLPLHEPLRWGAASVLEDVTHVLVRVVLNDGSEGWGEAPPRPTIYGETVHSITGVVAQEFAPRLLGEMLDEATLPILYNRLTQIKNNHTARGALDMALHHALARSRGRSLTEHLGVVQNQVRVSYILGLGDPEASLEEAQRVVDQGVRVLKVKVGRAWGEDMHRLRLLREHFGDQVALYADANETFTPQNARRRLEQLAELNVLYCEEPLPVELVLARAALRKANVLPLIADDSAFGWRDLRRELSLDTFHILNIKTARTGFTESTRMLQQALVAGKGVMVGSQASAGWGTVQAALFSGKQGIDHPCELSFFLKLGADLLDRPLLIQDGCLDLASANTARIDP